MLGEDAGLGADDLEALDALADEITEQVEEDVATKTKSRWAWLEAIVGLHATPTGSADAF